MRTDRGVEEREKSIKKKRKQWEVKNEGKNELMNKEKRNRARVQEGLHVWKKDAETEKNKIKDMASESESKRLSAGCQHIQNTFKHMFFLCSCTSSEKDPELIGDNNYQ